MGRLGEGSNMQARFARNSSLFSAFAAEAYVNEFLRKRLPRSDFNTIDRLPTVEKYLVGVALAGHKELFQRSSEPAQTLKLLFDTRNALAHPRPGRRGALTKISPESAAKFLVASAQGASQLATVDGRDDHMADMVTMNASKIIEWGQHWSEHLPPFDLPRPKDFVMAFLPSLIAEPRRQDRPGGPSAPPYKPSRN